MTKVMSLGREHNKNTAYITVGRIMFGKNIIDKTVRQENKIHAIKSFGKYCF